MPDNPNSYYKVELYDSETSKRLLCDYATGNFETFATNLTGGYDHLLVISSRSTFTIRGSFHIITW